MKTKILATVMLFLTAMIWGFAFVAQVLGSDHVEPFTFNGIRFMLGAISLIPVYSIFEKEQELTSAQRKERHKHTLLPALCAGSCLFIAAALQQFGAALTRDPGKGGFITGLYTVLTPVFYFLIFRKKSGWNVWLACILATLGLYMLCIREGEGLSFGVGELLLLLGAFFWAGHILVVDHFIDHISPLRFSSWQFFVSGALGLIAAVIFENITWAGIWAAKWAILFCGILSVGVAYTFQVFAQKRYEPTYAAIIFSTESVFAAIGGVLWNLITPENLHVQQELRPIGYLGCLIIFAGIVISQIQFPRKQASPEQQN
ncbi:MAG: DMT family transporter [Ruminococcaceae bacterium]|nr:DMT family transporter [Oscillospiraceae bacterium]